MADYRYEVEKAHTKTMIWLARRIPRRIVYWSLLNAYWRHIQPDEFAPEVPFVNILKRAGDAVGDVGYWVAPVVYWSLLNAGWRHILPDEVVPEVPFMEILKRAGEWETA